MSKHTVNESASSKTSSNNVGSDRPQLILASASPRRKELLRQISVNCFCIPVDIDESPIEDESVTHYVSRLAKQKAQAGWLVSDKKLPVMGADTIVVYQGELMGKPETEQQAFETLMRLSGQKHQVFSAVALKTSQRSECLVSESQVEFATIDAASIQAYIATGEPMDKAGSYGIQGLAATWIKRIEGSYSSVMGLPLYETAQLLKNSI